MGIWFTSSLKFALHNTKISAKSLRVLYMILLASLSISRLTFNSISHENLINGMYWHSPRIRVLIVESFRCGVGVGMHATRRRSDDGANTNNNNNINNASFSTTARQYQMGPINFYKRVYCRAGKHEDEDPINRCVSGGCVLEVCRDMMQGESTG